MALQSGLFKGQDQNEEDLVNGPGWTIDQQRPGIFGDFGSGVVPLAKGLAQGAADGISMLAHGLRSTILPAAIEANPFTGLVNEQSDNVADPLGLPNRKQIEAALEDVEGTAQRASKALMADPRTTGA